MLVKTLSRRPSLTHKIRVGDGVVILVSDPGVLFANGEEINIQLTNLQASQFKVAVDAPRHAAPIYFDTQPKTDDFEGS